MAPAPPPAKSIAITMGDPAGIGPEIVVKAFRDAPQDTRGCFVVGDVGKMRRAAQAVRREGDVDFPVAVIDDPAEAMSLPAG